jgi:uncharacterized protein YcbK (DUF882 family)
MPKTAPPSTSTTNRARLRRARRLLGAALAAFVSFAAARASAGDTVHVVSKGQTLDAIARRYHVTVDALREANELQRRQHIHPGLSLVIPGKAQKSQTIANARVRKTTDAGPTRRKGEQGKTATAKATHSAVKTKAKRMGWVRLSRDAETLELQLLTRHGRVAPTALTALSRMLRFRTGQQTAIDPRLATLLGMLSNHFGGRTIHVVSGFRPYSPTQYTPHSNHNLGRAVDLRVEGVPNTVTRDFCRTFQNAGVGYYPNSTFVHLDARAGKAYWVDWSKPGDAPKYDGFDKAEDDDNEAVSKTDGGSNVTPSASRQTIDNTRITDVHRGIDQEDPSKQGHE